MKKTAAVLILIGGTLLVVHYLGKDVDFIQARHLGKWDDMLGWYIRWAIVALGGIIWMFARTAE